MDNKQLGKNSTSPAAGASSSSSSQGQTDLKFSASSIGKWQAKQDGFFAQQNRERQKKKSKKEARWRKVRKYLIISGCALGAAAAISAIVLIIIHFVNYEPTISIGNGTSEDIQRYADELEEIYMSDGGTISEVNEAVNKTLNTSEGQKYKNEVLLAQLLFFAGQYYYDGVIEAGEQVNPDELTLEQQLDYYGAVGYAYLKNGQKEKGNDYQFKAYELMSELGMGQGGA